MPLYGDDWFRARETATRRSAEVIAPYVRDLVGPSSVIDLGCGTGSWLAAFGIEDCLGVDGEWVDQSLLAIPHERFRVFDLKNAFVMDRTYDLALSIEVGEHLPEDASSTLVASLAGLAPVVLFSAAIPFQGGTGHINPQWPQYWADKFASHSYVPCDVIRSRFWCDPDVRFVHAQNLILYVRRDHLEHVGLSETQVLPLVHPHLLERLVNPPGVVKRAARRMRRSLRSIRSSP